MVNNFIDDVYFELCPKNIDLIDILLKESTLNDFYSTNIFSIYPVAKYICTLDIDEVLRYFRNRDNFSDFQDGDLKDYVKFKGILIDFRAFYDLNKYNLMQIDQYVWLLGKDYFPKNYGKKTKKTSGR